ncbi:hypothetical protein [Pedobacter sp. NJ-S-72]
MVKEGNLFYNTSDHKLYVYNGTAWLPIDLSLANGEIFMGNSSNIARGITVSGDATLSNAGRLTIEKKAITDEKLDKKNIPLSGFGNPTEDLKLGDGTKNFGMVNLRDPVGKYDAVNLNYFKNTLGNPKILGLQKTIFL